MATVRKNGKGWQAIIRRKGHPTISKTFPKKIMADRWGRQQEEALASNLVMPVADRTTLGALLEWYEDNITPRKRSGKREPSRLRILGRHMGSLALSKLDASVVIAFVDKRLSGGVCADTIRKELGTLSVVLEAGVALRGVVIGANPVKVAKAQLAPTKTLKPGDERERRPTKKELELLYSSHLGELIEFAVETAMRREEIAAMRAEQLSGELLHIPKTKTDEPRTIPLSSRAIEILKSRGVKSGSIWGVKPGSITQAFTRLCVKYGIKDLRFHDLRHEATSRLFERGLALEEVAAITGHKDWKSLKRYTHPDLKRLARKLR